LGGSAAPVDEFKHKTSNSGNLKRTLINRGNRFSTLEMTRCRRTGLRECSDAKRAADCHRRFPAGRTGAADAAQYRRAFRESASAPGGNSSDLELLVRAGAVHLSAGQSREGDRPR